MPTPSIAIVGAGLSGLVCARSSSATGGPSPSTKWTRRRPRGSRAARSTSTPTPGRSRSRRPACSKRSAKHARRRRGRRGARQVRPGLHRPPGTAGRQRPAGDRPESLAAAAPRLARAGHRRLGEEARRHAAGYELGFADGATVPADLVVGADGAWSKIRALLTPASPSTPGSPSSRSGSPTRHRTPGALALTGRGSLFALSDGKYLGGHGGNNRARLRPPGPRRLGLLRRDRLEVPVAAREALRAVHRLGPVLTDLIRDCDDTIWPRPIYALPIGHTWDRVPGVTLVGDAAHLMPPYAGEGANIALQDGAELALALVEHPDDVETALAHYEKAMFPRATSGRRGVGRGSRHDLQRGRAARGRRVLRREPGAGGLILWTGHSALAPST